MSLAVLYKILIYLRHPYDVLINPRDQHTDDALQTSQYVSRQRLCGEGHLYNSQALHSRLPWILGFLLNYLFKLVANRRI